MAFNPREPRDAEGRWTRLAGAMKTHGGFTFVTGANVEPTEGFSVGVPHPSGKDWMTLPHGKTTAADLKRFAAKHAKELAPPERGIGGWSNNNPDWGEVRDALDIVEVHKTLKAAMAAARMAGQDAIYDLKKGEEIPVSKDLSILTPTLHGEYDLSHDEAGRLAFWKQVLPKRLIHYTGQDGKRHTLNFDERYLQDLSVNKAKDKVDFLLATKDNAHTMDPERWRGSVEEWKIIDGQPDPKHNGLYARIVFPSREAARAVLDNPDLGVSARIRENIERTDGSTVARGIVHVLGTLDPQVDGMRGWEATDLSTETGTLLDLTHEIYEDGTMADTAEVTLEKAWTEYTEAEIDEMDDAHLDAFLAASEADLGSILESAEDEESEEPEDETDETDEEPEMASLSNEAQQQIDLANTRAQRALAELATARWEKAKDAYLNAGVPAKMVDLAEPLFNRATPFVVDLSNEGGTRLDVADIVSKILDEAKGTIDLSTEEGHSGTFTAGDGEDPDGAALKLWDEQFPA